MTHVKTEIEQEVTHSLQGINSVRLGKRHGKVREQNMQRPQGTGDTTHVTLMSCGWRQRAEYEMIQMEVEGPDKTELVS